MSRLGETNLRALAASIVATGLRDANYTFFNLDDGIISHRDPVSGALVADQTAFPSGTLSPLAAYVNGLGLQLGAYTDRGTTTCEGRPGAKGYEAQDAQTWASWGVTLLKEDSCASDQDFSAAAADYGAMAAGLRATGKDVFFSLCGWFSGFAAFSRLDPPVGDAWRVGTDVPNLERFLQNIEAAEAASTFAGPNHGWPDVDMIGGHWPADAEILHVSFIATIGAPLLLSWNISASSASTLPLSTYMNPELLAVHSDDPARAVTARGRYYARVSGGAVTGPGVAENVGVPVDTEVPCADARAQWKWTPNASSGYGTLEAHALPGLCMGAWDEWVGGCIDAVAIQLTPCGSAASGCDVSAQAWRYNASSRALAIELSWGGGTPRPGPFLSLVGGVPGGLYLQSMAGSTPPSSSSPPEEQSWLAALPTVGPPVTVTIASATTGFCLGGANTSATNVWARWLSDGSVALLFFNVGSVAVSATCDATCLALALGGSVSAQWSVRNVWQRSDLPSLTIQAWYTTPTLPPHGGSLLLRVTLL